MALACDPPRPVGGDFIAVERDFAGFDRWTRFDRGPDAVPPIHPEGESIVYVSALPARGATAFPTGTIIVRVTTGGAPAEWEVHAMVKRGGAYNAAGAPGWEFFDLRLDTVGDALVPRILWRGEAPPELGEGYLSPDGGIPLSCSHCHGAGGMRNDSVLGDELYLSEL